LLSAKLAGKAKEALERIPAKDRFLAERGVVYGVAKHLIDIELWDEAARWLGEWHSVIYSRQSDSDFWASLRILIHHYIQLGDPAKVVGLIVSLQGEHKHSDIVGIEFASEQLWTAGFLPQARELDHLAYQLETESEQDLLSRLPRIARTAARLAAH